MAAWSAGEIHYFALEQFDERYACYRLAAREAEAEMVASMRQFGRMSPVVCCLREERPRLVDGFRRLWAARRIPEIRELSTRLIEVDDRQAKAAILRLNQCGRRIHVLEEAWLAYALVREDGLSQSEVAELLGKHKSWVCRRLALLERLAEEARQDMQLGLLSPSAARQLIRLPRGNQQECLECVRRESLTAGEVREVVDLLLASSTREQKEFVLAKPREALAQAPGRSAALLGPAVEHGGEPRGKEAGVAVGQPGGNGELAAAPGARRAFPVRLRGAVGRVRAIGARRSRGGRAGGGPGQRDEIAMNQETRTGS